MLASNGAHVGWLQEKVRELLKDRPQPVVAVLGLTYKPGTSTLRRSAAVELCRLAAPPGGACARPRSGRAGAARGIASGAANCVAAPEEALTGAEGAVMATEWPAYRALRAEQLLAWMRRPWVIDPSYVLGGGPGR